jgi:hypothetical protein
VCSSTLPSNRKPTSEDDACLAQRTKLHGSSDARPNLASCSGLTRLTCASFGALPLVEVIPAGDLPPSTTHQGRSQLRNAIAMRMRSTPPIGGEPWLTGSSPRNQSGLREARGLAQSACTCSTPVRFPCPCTYLKYPAHGVERHHPKGYKTLTFRPNPTAPQGNPPQSSQGCRRAPRPTRGPPSHPLPSPPLRRRPLEPGPSQLPATAAAQNRPASAPKVRRRASARNPTSRTPDAKRPHHCFKIAASKTGYDPCCEHAAAAGRDP